MKIKEVLSTGITQLKQNNIEDSNLKARMLLANILEKPKEYFIAHDNEDIDETEFFIKIKMLINKIPIQYIINNQEFMKLNFYVDENVLIPQPDTEILVEEVIKLAKEKENLEILDLCTGSGCIGISLAKYTKKSRVIAIDISNKAIQIAKLNAEKNLVHKQIKFMESNMFENIEEYKFDFIVSNPPYIETKVIEELSEEVRKEPKIALDGGEDGLNFYKEIANNAYKYLKKDGYLCLEIGYNQKDNVIKLLNKIGEYKEIYSKKDLSENDRIIVAKKV